METLRYQLPETPLVNGPSSINAPAHVAFAYPEFSWQQPPLAEQYDTAQPTRERASALGHTATFTWFESSTSQSPRVELDITQMDIIHFTVPDAKEIAENDAKPKPLDILAEQEMGGAMDALDIQPITLPKKKTAERVGEYRQRIRYTGSHAERKTGKFRSRIYGALAGIALTATLAGSADVSGKAAQNEHAKTHHHQSGDNNHYDTAPQPEAKPTATIIRGGQPIMGVSPRQKKIISQEKGLTGAQKQVLTNYTTAMHKIEGQLGGVNPDVMMAQAIWEGNWDTSALAKNGHNLFGMKAGEEWKGAKGSYMTWEFVNGKTVHLPQSFREYPDDAASFADHAQQMKTLPWFKDALGQNASGYLDGILNGTMKYATDPNYKSRIMGVIGKLELHELTKIDKQPPHLVKASDATPVERIEMKIAQYAWPSYRPVGTKGSTAMRPAYVKAVEHARDHDKDAYLGADNGLDCGEFVTRVMRDSGVDPDYNSGEGNTKWQMRYLEEHSDAQHTTGEEVRYHLIKPGEALQPGDIAVQNNGRVHHTFFYVGDKMMSVDDTGHVVEFDGPLASASEGNRAPMSSKAFNRGAFEWFRLIPSKAGPITDI